MLIWEESKCELFAHFFDDTTIYMQRRITEIIRPAIANLIPLLKAFVFGLNIQKLEITKKNKEIPKNVFRGDNVSLDWDL